MSERRSARERLDMLLTGLEDEVISGEGCVDTDVKAMRAEIEGVIRKHADVGNTREVDSAIAREAKGKVAGVVELLGRWAGIGRHRARPVRVPRIRVAFSGERAPNAGDRHERRDGCDEGEGSK